MKYIVSFLLTIALSSTAFAHNLDKGGSSYYSETLGYTNCGIDDGMTITQTGMAGWCYNENTGFQYYGSGYGMWDDDFLFGSGSIEGMPLSGAIWNENIGYIEFEQESLFYSGLTMNLKGKITGHGWNENGGFEAYSMGASSFVTNLRKDYRGDYNFDYVVDTQDFVLVSSGYGTDYTFQDLVDVILNQ